MFLQKIAQRPWLRIPLLLLMLSGGLVVAQEQAETSPVMEVFVRDGCPHCAAAKRYLPTLQKQRPGLRIVLRSLDTEPSAAEELAMYSRRVGEWPPGVPTFVIDGRVHVGFVSPEHTGPALLRLIDGDSPPTKPGAELGYGDLNVKRLGLPLFTIALGLIDGFNPCAMWVLLFLLSILVRLHDRRRMALIAGTFVLVSGLVYFAFMAAWLNLFLVVGFSRPLRWLLAGIAIAIGLVNLRDVFDRQRDYSLSIPESAKPGIYARVRGVLRSNRLLSSMVGVAILAVLVNFIELLCTAGLPAIYTAVLSQQGLGAPAYYGYLALYILAYIADDTVMVTIAVLALGSHRLSERSGRWLKLISGMVMLLLGITMLIFPHVLV